MKIISTSAARVLRTPLSEIPTKKLKMVGLSDIESELQALVQRATLMSVYIGHRYNTGCGDQGHKESARVANRALVKVRQALGFSYPASTPLQF